MRLVICFSALLVSLLSLVGSPLAAGRVALVIGNGNYRNVPLENPVNDANDIAAALTNFGFYTILRTNADKRGMVAAIQDFSEHLKQAEIGLFYYAGHGIQVDGVNYLLPIGATIHNASEVEFEAVHAGRVLAAMEEANSRLNIVILDACRNNPFRGWSRSVISGLARMDAPKGSIIAYATAPGSVAADGTGRNGVYTKHLLSSLSQPNLDIQQIFNTTGLAVMKETDNKQVPWINSSPMEPVYLAGISLEAPGATGPKHSTTANNTQQQTIGPPAEQGIAQPEKNRQQTASKPVALNPSQPPLSGKQYTDQTTGMEFVWVDGGCFQMGDTFGEGDSDAQPVREVCVDGFYIGKYEVTQGAYEKITGHNPSFFAKGRRYPVEQVSWDDAQSFIRALNQQTGKLYRLPTEAEWEFAARSGGKKEKYAGSNDFNAVAWYKGNSGDTTHEVGTKAANGLGLYDMSGNVWEWCSDWFDVVYYKNSPRTNPQGPSSGTVKINRGGSWKVNPLYMRTAYVSYQPPSLRTNNTGFRLVLPDQP